jgi:hypothetical protein
MSKEDKLDQDDIENISLERSTGYIFMDLIHIYDYLRMATNLIHLSTHGRKACIASL